MLRQGAKGSSVGPRAFLMLPPAKRGPRRQAYGGTTAQRHKRACVAIQAGTQPKHVESEGPSRAAVKRAVPVHAIEKEAHTPCRQLLAA